MTKPDHIAIIAENQRRLDIIHAPYDPVLGVGSLVERFEFWVDEDTLIHLPESMKRVKLIQGYMEHKNLKDFCRANFKKDAGKAFEHAMTMLIQERVRHDFEFWAATSATIYDKDGTPTLLSLNRSQRSMLKTFEEDRIAGKPIRIILLKARQFGGSTLIQLYMSWLQLFHKTRWNSAICTTVENQAKHIRGMFTRMANYHPHELMSINLAPYEGSSKNKIILERECMLAIGSYEEPENLRGHTFHMLHASEVASWRDTDNRTGSEFLQSLRAAIPKRPYTMIALESTAKGVGNFFHKEWQAAKQGRSGYKPIFIPWFMIEEYMELVPDYAAFIDRMSERAWELWSMGATLEGINWYFNWKEGENYNDWQMCEEFPSNDIEAFTSSGQRIFNPVDVAAMRELVSPPEFIGELAGDALTGKVSMRGLKFVDNPKGNLHVWSKPDSSIMVSNRYAVFVDIGGRNPKADYSVIRVIDRYWMTEGEPPEFVATWRGHVDHDVLAWKAAQVATWYNKALLAIEENSLEKKSDGAGHFFTLIDQLSDHYDNLYTRTSPDAVREGVPAKYGFHTNSKTKKQIIDALIKALRERNYIERDVRALDEMDTFEQRPDGTVGAEDGCKDDMVITTAGCVWLAAEKMDPPSVIDLEGGPKRVKRKVIGEASM
jgi:hypothetical protein